jgi:hypothetical protein
LFPFLISLPQINQLVFDLKIDVVVAGQTNVDLIDGFAYRQQYKGGNNDEKDADDHKSIDYLYHFFREGYHIA